jgi:hypothetical protein
MKAEAISFQEPFMPRVFSRQRAKQTILPRCISSKARVKGVRVSKEEFVGSSIESGLVSQTIRRICHSAQVQGIG